MRASAYLDALSGMSPLPGLPDTVPNGVTAVLAPDRAVFDSILGGRVPEWSAGVAVPARRMLVIPAWKGTLTRPGEAQRVLRHEWAHLGLHDWLEPLRIPRWFDEGYAEWAGGWDVAESWRLRLMIAGGNVPPLDSLALRWPGGSGEAGAAYLLSATVLVYLVEESGVRGLEIFLRRWRERGSFETALVSTYGVTPGQLEEDWREWAKGRYGWLNVLAHSAVFWIFLGLVLLLMVRVRRRRNRERMARLRAKEPPANPAFWMPESGARPDGGTRA